MYWVTTEPVSGAQMLYGPIRCLTGAGDQADCAFNSPVSETAAVMTIRLPADATRIVDPTKTVEVHAVNMRWDLGGDFWTKRGTFPVRNLNLTVGGLTPGAQQPTPEATP